MVTTAAAVQASTSNTHSHPPEYSPEALLQHKVQAQQHTHQEEPHQEHPSNNPQPANVQRLKDQLQPNKQRGPSRPINPNEPNTKRTKSSQTKNTPRSQQNPQQQVGQQQNPQQQQQQQIRQHRPPQQQQQSNVPTQFVQRPNSPQQRPPPPHTLLQPQVLQQAPPPPSQGITQARPLNQNQAPPVSFGPYPTLAGMVSEEGRRVDDIRVSCEKTHMTVTFRFSTAFNGYIYPHQHFTNCLLLRGRNTLEETLTLRHGTCGDQQNFIIHHGKSYLDPVIEHRLMVQWEPDIVCEDDSSVIVRCDRPDDFNKTVEWRLETRQLLATLEHSQHPGPKMWMEIQRGEGPTAPSLSNELVYIGDVLTLIFTLSDDTVYSGEATVSEQGCSVKPKVFSHFIKEKHTRNNGDLVTLHYAFFKAFRFPTSNKLVLQCNVQVCYKECPQPPTCSEAFHPRIVEDQTRRRRRALDEAAEAGGHEVDEVNMRRSVEVQLPEEGGAQKLPVAAAVAQDASNCYQPSTFYATVIPLVCVILLLLLVLAVIRMRECIKTHSFFNTPIKTNNLDERAR
ncbi:hypothetical protein Pcinc_025344 [Petrolisthes cinctipes]|uniref:ZP domain-containing protein n=1 Tax=Petrolisthes cinctipes TaxID=88211 RepID=A0AAE1F811_PETCI|nr:hypothetical protein Pcinc_025344 [Petrolisthes cinctipes]